MIVYVDCPECSNELVLNVLIKQDDFSENESLSIDLIGKSCNCDLEEDLIYIKDEAYSKFLELKHDLHSIPYSNELFY